MSAVILVTNVTYKVQVQKVLNKTKDKDSVLSSCKAWSLPDRQLSYDLNPYSKICQDNLWSLDSKSDKHEITLYNFSNFDNYRLIAIKDGQERSSNNWKMFQAASKVTKRSFIVGKHSVNSFWRPCMKQNIR